ncbi:MAG TPA: cytochrome c/FTR1 family iron permease, partial [Gemmatimonadales bacterium]|nr:cytochrome c/FTR1 family iron permease [Gemmatimonadales bacterium]
RTSLICVFAILGVTARPAIAQDPGVAAARRVAATAQLAAEEYRLGVSGGRVIAKEEVAEAQLFLTEARRSLKLLPASSVGVVSRSLDTLDAMVGRTAHPDSVAGQVAVMLAAMARDLKIDFDEIPDQTPSLARGREIFETTCSVCHGLAGRGDGPQAAALTPRPANLSDLNGLSGSSPLDFYRRITIGSAGTSMAPFEHILSKPDRWAVALYASTLRLPAPAGVAPASLRNFSATARLTDADVQAALGPGATIAQVAAVRGSAGAGAPGQVTDRVFAAVRAQLDSAYHLALLGRKEDARATAMDAYITFEQVERTLAVKNPGLTSRIEAAFSVLRTRAGSGASAAELGKIREDLSRERATAERTVLDRLSPSNLLVQSFIILLREGLEAILVIGALMAFLVKTGNGHRRRDIHLGVAAAVVMSLLVAAALETVFVLTSAHQEGLEGAVLMLATGTLFYVSYWLLSKMEVAKWNRFVKGKVQSALTRGSALALASVAFLAVFREGFETVLFYKALAVSGGPGSWAPVLGGIAVGSVALAAVYLAMTRFGVRLPLKPMFAVTSALLYYMAFVFAGKGIAELQESGWVSLSPVGWAPRIPALGIYPTLESLGLQLVLVLLAIAALVWTFLIEPRRLHTTAVLVPEPIPREPDTPGKADRPVRDATLLRSIDRIETDLNEVRSELERMREKVNPESEVKRRRGDREE